MNAPCSGRTRSDRAVAPTCTHDLPLKKTDAPPLQAIWTGLCLVPAVVQGPPEVPSKPTTRKSSNSCPSSDLSMLSKVGHKVLCRLVHPHSCPHTHRLGGLSHPSKSPSTRHPGYQLGCLLTPDPPSSRLAARTRSSLMQSCTATTGCQAPRITLIQWQRVPSPRWQRQFVCISTTSSTTSERFQM